MLTCQYNYVSKLQKVAAKQQSLC